MTFHAADDDGRLRLVAEAGHERCRRRPLRSALPLGPAERHAPASRSDRPAATELAVPVRAGDLVLGVLDVLRRPTAPFDDDEISLLATVAGQLALALQRADSEAATERMAGQMATLYDLGLETAALRDLRPLFVKAAEEAGRLIRPTTARCSGWTKPSGVLRLFVAWTLDPGAERAGAPAFPSARASPAGWRATACPPS